MAGHTTRLALIWVRITLALGVVVAVVLAVYGLDSIQLKLAVLGAVWLEVLTVRALCREWRWQARGAWWRFW